MQLGERRVLVFVETLRTGARKLLRMGFVSGESVGRISLGHSADGQVEVEGGSSTQEPDLSRFLEVNELGVVEEISTMATLSWGGRCVDGQTEEGAAEGVEEADL